jgi:mRNA interferase MazF
MPDSWTSDYGIQDLTTAGLKHPWVIRWKIFTLPNEFIVKVLGELGSQDSQAVKVAATEILFAT